tara:strand:+ start:295 stop:582 length:288 start_codon:yes stop_codon:yes gene_type:complete
MDKYSYGNKTPIEAKILLLLGICGVRRWDCKYEDWHTDRRLRLKDGRRIGRNAINYINKVFIREHDQAVRIDEFSYLDRDRKVMFEYIIELLDKN